MMEILDVVDRNGNPTGDTVERTKAHAEGIPHRTAHLWLLRKRDGKTQILLQKRCVQKAEFPSCYDISSAGHIPAGVDFRASAVRELSEELGISAKESDLILCGHRTIVTDTIFHGKPFHDRQYSQVFAMWFDGDETVFSLQESEVESVLWMDFAECVEAVRTNAIQHCIAMEELNILATYLNTLERLSV